MKTLALALLAITLFSCSADEVENSQCGKIILVHKNVSKPGYTIQIKTSQGYILTYDNIMSTPQVGQNYCR